MTLGPASLNQPTNPGGAREAAPFLLAQAVPGPVLPPPQSTTLQQPISVPFGVGKSGSRGANEASRLIAAIRGDGLMRAGAALQGAVSGPGSFPAMRVLDVLRTRGEDVRSLPEGDLPGLAADIGGLIDRVDSFGPDRLSPDAAVARAGRIIDAAVAATRPPVGEMFESARAFLDWRNSEKGSAWTGIRFEQASALVDGWIQRGDDPADIQAAAPALLNLPRSGNEPDDADTTIDLPEQTGLPGGEKVADIAKREGVSPNDVLDVSRRYGISAEDAAKLLKGRALFGRWAGAALSAGGAAPPRGGGAGATAAAAGGDEEGEVAEVASNIAKADIAVVRNWWNGLSAAEREALPQAIRDAAYTRLGPLPSLPAVRADGTAKPQGYPDRAGDILDHLEKKRWDDFMPADEQIDGLTESEARWVHERLSNALDHRQLPSRQVDAALNLIEQIEGRFQLPARDPSLTLAPDHITPDDAPPVFDRNLTPGDRKEIDRLETRWKLPSAVATEIVRRYGDNQKADIAAETFLLLRKRNVDAPVAAALVGSRAGVTLIAALARGDMIPPKLSQASAAALTAQLTDLVDSAGSRLNLSRENASRWVGEVLTSANNIEFEMATAVPAVAELVENLAPFAAGPGRLEALELRGKVFAAGVADGVPLAEAIGVASRQVPNETLVRLGRLYRGTDEEEEFHVGRMLDSSRTTLNTAVEYLERSKGSDAVLRFVLDKIRQEGISLSKADEVERGIVPTSRAQSLAEPILQALREKGGVSITLEDGIAYMEPGTPAHESDGESGPIHISHLSGMGFVVVAHGSNGYRAGDTFVGPHISNLYEAGETIRLLDENGESAIELRLPDLGR